MHPERRFQTSGPIIDSRRIMYVERPEDQRLLALLRGEEMAYINLLGPPQMGKTSLFYALRQRLPAGYLPIMVNLSAASDAAEAQWYAYLCRRILAQLASAGVGEEQVPVAISKLDFLDFLEAVSRHLKAQARVIVMLDEFGTIPHDVAEGFFSVLRTTYNDRGIRPEFQKYSFLLAGLMGTSDIFPLEWVGSPFNVSQKIYLSTIGLQGTTQLVEHLEQLEIALPDKDSILAAIYQLTGGHPNLVQKICTMLADLGKATLTVQEVEDVTEQLVFEGDDNIYWIVEHLKKNTEGNKIIGSMLDGKSCRFDRSDALLRRLELSGIIKEEHGQYIIHNGIYQQVLQHICCGN